MLPWVQSGTFALLNEVHGSRKCAPSAVTVYGLKQRWVANLSLVVLLVLSSTELVPLLPLTLSLSFVLVGAGCITVEQAWNSVRVNSNLLPILTHRYPPYPPVQ